MPRSVDPDEVLSILRRIALAPTAPYHEWAALDAIRGELESGGIATKTDQFGQLHARVSAGAAKRALVVAAHTDHPAFEVIEASGQTGKARVLGGFRQPVCPAAEARLLPRDGYVARVEAGRRLPGAEAGRGIVVRAGDLHNTFSNEAERYLRVARERLAERGIPSQRALLVGGTCEASSFVRLSWVATGIALPNVNYHNAAADGGFAPEIVRLGDLLSGISLGVEAALAAGEDADESWWPDVRITPAVIRERLQRERPKG